MPIFDKIIMNPPYERNTHLKILDKVTKECQGGEVVSIQPTRWLEDPFADIKTSDYKRFTELRKRIEVDEVVKAADCNRLFGAIFGGNLGIYKTRNEGQQEIISNSIINKVSEYIKNNCCNIELNKKDGVRVRIPSIVGGKSGGSGYRGEVVVGLGKLLSFTDGMKDGKKWHEFYGKNQYSKVTDEISSSIKFNSELEAQNFIEQQDSSFNRYVLDHIIVDMNIYSYSILWMGNITNPRTGLLGYQSNWVDEDFYKVFNLTTDEIKIIESSKL